MRLNIPFFKQTTELNCGPSSLKMVAEYFGKKDSIEKIEKFAEIEKKKGIFTIQLAKASVLLGFRTELYSKNLSLNNENFELEYYKKYSNSNEKNFEKLIKESKNLGVQMEERLFSLEELFRFMNNQSVLIVLLNWNVITNKEGYQGHFVPLVGYDESYVYIHDSSLNASGREIPIEKNLFDKARKSKGTDEEFLVIHKN